MKKVLCVILSIIFLTAPAFALPREDNGEAPERTVTYEPEFSDDGKLIFYPQSDGTYAVTSRDKDLINGTLTVPAEFNGKKVTVILKNSFSLCGITELILPEGLEVIEEYAFSGAKIGNVTVPDSVISIGKGAFYCSDMKSLYVGAGCVDCNTAFGGVQIESIKVSDKNKAYSSTGCCLTEKATGRLLLGCKNSVIPDTVTYICEGAFTGVTELTEITIPDSVQGIETYAFSRCTGLKSVVLPESLKEIGNYAFNASGLESVVINCGDCAMGSSVFSASKLRKIEFGENVKEIGKSAFFNCTELTEVTIPGNVKTIGESAFNGCSKLVSLTLCEGITEIGYKAFFGCVGIKEIVIPDSVEKIDDYAFAHGKAEGSDPMLTYLKKVTLGKGLQYIGEQAFARCSALEEVVINCENLNHIGERAFHSCYSLKDIDLPDSLTKIEYAAFAACRSFKNVFIPDSVTEIGKSAFRACTSLESVTFGSNLKTIGETAFADCTNLRSVVLPDGLKTINRKAFDNCRISKLSMPDSVTYLGLNAFKGNSIISVENDIDGVYYLGNEKNPYAVLVGVKNTSYIKSIEIKEGTKLIAEGAFEDCYELETLTIPESVLNINGIAFLSCRSLKTVYYAGNKRQWKNINISDVLNDELFAAEIVYGKTIQFIRGDINGDEKLNNKDVVALFRYASGNIDAVFDESTCDFNGDGSVNNKDVVALFRYISGRA